jgi:hypothetical protein
MLPGVLYGGGLEKTTLSCPPARTDSGRVRQPVVVYGNDPMGDGVWPGHYWCVDRYREGHPLASYVDRPSCPVRRSCKRSGSILSVIHAKFGCGQVTTWPRRSLFWRKSYREPQVGSEGPCPHYRAAPQRVWNHRLVDRRWSFAWCPQPRLTHASKGVRQTWPLQPGTFVINSVKIASAKMPARCLQDFNAAQHISGRGCRR